jgi:succinoglycan biosynthesis protein ExoA
MTNAAAPELAIVIPVLNEAAYIEACIASLLPQAQAAGATIMVMDGGSTDGTQAIVAALARRHAAMSLIENPKRIQSAAVNLAARIAPASVRLLLRADAHAAYPPNFVALCVAALRANDATSVVVPMRTTGLGGLQNAIAAVQNSRLGNGGAAHRAGGVSGFVDHGHHAVFDRAFFLGLGGYDESFTHNEDAEFDRRAIDAGGRIWMCREAAITYYPRRTLSALARQYFRHGAGRMRTLRRHRLLPRPRQLAAPAILVGSLLCAAMLPFSPWFAIFPASYVAACLIWALISAAQTGDPWLLGIGPAAIVTHISWGAGFLAEAMKRRTHGEIGKGAAVGSV